jgi:hypothetical protein
LRHEGPWSFKRWEEIDEETYVICQWTEYNNDQLWWCVPVS